MPWAPPSSVLHGDAKNSSSVAIRRTNTTGAPGGAAVAPRLSFGRGSRTRHRFTRRLCTTVKSMKGDLHDQDDDSAWALEPWDNAEERERDEQQRLVEYFESLGDKESIEQWVDENWRGSKLPRNVYRAVVSTLMRSYPEQATTWLTRYMNEHPLTPADLPLAAQVHIHAGKFDDGADFVVHHHQNHQQQQQQADGQQKKQINNHFAATALNMLLAASVSSAFSLRLVKIINELGFRRESTHIKWLIRNLARDNRKDLAEEWIEEFKKEEYTLDPGLCSEMYKMYVHLGESDSARRWSKLLKSAEEAIGGTGRRVTTYSRSLQFEVLMNARAGELEQAYTLIEHAPRSLRWMLVDRTLPFCCIHANAHMANRLIKLSMDDRPNDVMLGCVLIANASQHHTEEAEKIFSQMERELPFIPPKYYHAMLRMYTTAEDLDNSDRWLKKLINDGIQPTVSEYNAILLIIKDKRDVECSEKLLREMLAQGVKPSTVTYGAVIAACAKAGSIENAERWVARMQAAGLNPRVRDINNVLAACAKNGNAAKAEVWYADMTSSGLEPNLYTYTELIKADLNDAKDGMGMAKAERWVDEILGKGMVPDLKLWSVVMTHFARKALPDVCEKIFEQMVKNTTSVPDSTVYNLLMLAYGRQALKAQTRTEAREARRKQRKWLGKMVAAGFEPTGSTFEIICAEPAKAGDWRKVENTRKKMFGGESGCVDKLTAKASLMLLQAHLIGGNYPGAEVVAKNMADDDKLEPKAIQLIKRHLPQNEALNILE